MRRPVSGRRARRPRRGRLGRERLGSGICRHSPDQRCARTGRQLAGRKRQPRRGGSLRRLPVGRVESGSGRRRRERRHLRPRPDDWRHQRREPNAARPSSDSSSLLPSISADGTRVSYWTFASDLAPGDTNGLLDVAVRDHASNLTQIASTTIALQPGNGVSRRPSLSTNGRYVAFETEATNFTETDANGPATDVYTRAGSSPESTASSAPGVPQTRLPSIRVRTPCTSRARGSVPM